MIVVKMLLKKVFFFGVTSNSLRIAFKEMAGIHYQAASDYLLMVSRYVPCLPHLYTDMCGVERNGCPHCFAIYGRNEILYAGQKFCSVCGQAIKYE